MTETRLEKVVHGFASLLDAGVTESVLLGQGTTLLRELVSHDDWLDKRQAQPHPQHYQQYLLYCDPAKRFCIVSFVWGPGQTTPIHDHGVWALIGMLRGAEREERFRPPQEEGAMSCIGRTTLLPGQVAVLIPHEGDIHRVSNAYDDRVSISIHVYGGDIGTRQRHVFDPASGRKKEFVSSYARVAER